MSRKAHFALSTKQARSNWFVVLLTMSLLSGHSHGVIIALNQNFGVALPIALGGANVQPGVIVRTQLADVVLDTSTNAVSSITSESIEDTSFANPLVRTFDTNSDLNDSGFTGSADTQAGNDQSSTELTISNINAAPGFESLSASAGATDYQLVRFMDSLDRVIDADVDYLLTGSITGDLGTLPATASSLSALQVFDLTSFVLDRQEGDFLLGTADYAIFDLHRVFSGAESVDRTQALRVRTNTDYLVVLTSSASIDISAAVNSAVDVSITSFADPVFSVSDPSVSIVRSFIQSNPSSVPEPSVLALLGLGLLSLSLRRRNRS